MAYIVNTDKDIKKMLKALGLSSSEQLYSQIPPEIRLKEPLNIPFGVSEFEVLKKLKNLSSKNKSISEFNSFLGAGCYDHYLPSALNYLLKNPQFLTAYTPYQPECSQGILQAIYEYQSYICFLTGMDVTNASLLDGGSSLAEAVLMSLRLTKRKKIIVAKNLHPEYLETLKTYLSGLDFLLEEVPFSPQGIIDTGLLKTYIDKNTACCVFASPNFFGLIEESPALVDLIKGKGALAIMAVNPVSLALFKEPASFGVDIVCGEAGMLGGSLNFGGPGLGFLATKHQHLRQMPGRVVGETTDSQASRAYCLTLATREQHIRREKATSNICSNHSLNAIAAAIYLSLLGKDGFRKAALYSFNNTQYLYKRLKEIRGVKLPYQNRFFNEFVWEVENSQEIIAALYEKGIIAGYHLKRLGPEFKNSILSCCTEKKTTAEIDELVNILAEILHG